MKFLIRFAKVLKTIGRNFEKIWLNVKKWTKCLFKFDEINKKLFDEIF